MPRVNFTAWELDKLAGFVAGQTLTYLGHYYGSGIFRGEVATMNNWRRLDAKLENTEYTGDLPYIGYARNGFNSEKD